MCRETDILQMVTFVLGSIFTSLQFYVIDLFYLSYFVCLKPTGRIFVCLNNSDLNKFCTRQYIALFELMTTVV